MIGERLEEHCGGGRRPRVAGEEAAAPLRGGRLEWLPDDGGRASGETEGEVALVPDERPEEGVAAAAVDELCDGAPQLDGLRARLAESVVGC